MEEDMSGQHDGQLKEALSKGLDLYGGLGLISLFVGITVIVILLLRNKTCFYFLKMTALYLTIYFDATLCSFACIPLYFFGDSGKFVFDSLHVCAFWIRVKCEVRRKEIFEETASPYVVVVNHQSSIDTVVLTNFWPKRCTIMMKRSLRFVPFFGLAAFWSHAIFVDRFNHKKAIQSLIQCANTIRTKNLSVLVFPEGTRNHEGGMLSFKKGAFNVAIQARIPIIPCVVSSYKPFYDKEMRYFHSPGYVIVEVMDPISTEKLTLDDVPSLAERVRSEMMVTYERISVEASKVQRASEKSRKAE